MPMQQNGKAFYGGTNDVALGFSVERDEWGNAIITRNFSLKGNHVEDICDSRTIEGVPPLLDMKDTSTRDVLSRTAVFDEASQTTLLTEKKILSYADPDVKRMTIEAGSTTEEAIAHPRFQELAGTPTAPLRNNALWIVGTDANKTLTFVRFTKAGIIGVDSYIAGNGSTLRVTYFDEWSGWITKREKLGKIDFPEIADLWGNTNSWLLAGVNLEPFGERWKITLVYRNASENFGQYQNGGWSIDLYGNQ